MIEKISFSLIGLFVLLMIWPWLMELILYDKTTRQTRQRLQLLIKRANNGNDAARRACDRNGLINKGMVLCEDGINVKSVYSLPHRWQ
ncbi:MAG: hypothetical protein UU88_C0001G0046 [Parcubacteria group bacterium GW2011_GWC1_42_11]|uniref:Uncharacterized protein n=1 Tax=Candidatus Nomurabacteria bacterium GW2011_GWC2_42_20 TaxID=1618756 RepID=A0A0G0ZHB3_9BACT|nr:MAG: hypothetical protein UU88_C0001G0046 [Parcubacteria group bacterium GW2011_GWC1_42_11]KKS48110.1 MAG: hypothetical protein UV12_C0003G0069 [Candidatus Nomurabacteria bacterium GW2011_GWC2_42_20]KKS58423.1 MAG: hypothetical protein UV24_C0023G0007 [Candidatus Nomurabacteria bacterium GW2011_GWA2_42_41]KKT09227.1 MAG: hypothetical protein UV86_C0011G0011 [Candidatus Nomurabacteria bacterium GW2011_GWB1_43_20]TAN36881.1 MAG: hypothetical protein EPN27_00580 [Patescibacteria group bacterium